MTLVHVRLQDDNQLTGPDVVIDMVINNCGCRTDVRKGGGRTCWLTQRSQSRRDQVLDFRVLSNWSFERLNARLSAYHRHEHRKATRAGGATACATMEKTVEAGEQMARTVTVAYCGTTLLALPARGKVLHRCFVLLERAAPQWPCNHHVRRGRNALDAWVGHLWIVARQPPLR